MQNYAVTSDTDNSDNFSLCPSTEEPVSACKFYPPSLSLSIYICIYVRISVSVYTVYRESKKNVAFQASYYFM